MRLQPKGLAIACALAAAMAVAPGTWAQSRASLSDRVDALEARDQAQAQQNMELLNRITQLESDVKQLRALVEQMQNDSQQAGERAKAQYIDLDSRLGRLEAGAQQTPPPAQPPAAKPSTRPPATKPSALSAAKPSAQPVSSPQTAAATAGAGDQAAYSAAFSTMKSEQYADSAKQFGAFVQQYPDSSLAPNAYYWMGESYYVTQNYQYALDAFQTVLTRYPDSPKAPAALLKIGYCQDGLKQRDAAQATLSQVIAKYPNSEEAGQAQSRLRALSMDAGG